ncbi:hypothetical protein FOVG_01415 [Fusarium oxysporum f. sp. pisi HDV247]|uniref:Uncharacterized protein n=1 Tax=Fusarium oxysporum f. sp. pisi HDV247 TaxID=1080344 RepID=W9QEV8_FUSOX|nr:hypothetical protein FOVG_01415 [Fusarium oxysporum f. sp. pisi HDV247]
MSHTNSYMQTRSRPLAPAPGPAPAPAPTPPSSVRNGSQSHSQRHASRPRAAERYASMESTTGTSPQAPRLEAHQLPPLQDGISLPSSLLPLPTSNTQSAPQPMDYVADSSVDSPLMLSQSGGVNDRGNETNETQNNSQMSQEHELWDGLARLQPTFRGISAKTIETYALLLPKLEALTELCLDGRLALDQVSLTTIKTIRSLKLVSVGKLDGFTEFMAAFPCLVQFSFESRSTVLLPLDRTIWLELRFLRLIGVWVTKEAISHVIATTESHKVTWEFEAVTLANSTWGSFWAAMHQDGHQITFTNNNEVVTYK